MGKTVDILRKVVGCINIVLAYSECIIQDEERSVDDRAAHTLNYGAYSAIHDVLEVIITELEADDGSSCHSSKNVIH